MIIYEKISDETYARLSLIQRVLNEEDCVIFGYLFGSLAAGHKSSLSDIDIAVYLSCCKDIISMKLNLFQKISDALNTSEIDLVVLNTALSSLEGRILMRKIILVDKDPFTRHRYESLALRKFFDFQIKEREILYRRYSIGR